MRRCLLLGALALSLASAQEVRFWSAPNPSQTQFWEEMAQAYREVNPDVTITVTPIPESPTSEAAILASLAGGTGPTISENIFIGFGAQLYNASAVVPLNTLPGWEELLAARNMATAIETWAFPDGNFYILPIYTNAMLFGWRIDALQELGVETPPRTYSEILEVCATLREQNPNRFLLARADLLSNVWWQRWFDFFILYDAASNGAPFIVGNEIVADDEAAVAVFDFYRRLNEAGCLLTREVTTPFEVGNSIWSQLGPWTFANWRENFPELQLGENFVLTDPPVPDEMPAGEPVYTFADAKGLVIYQNAPEEAREAAWEFVRWVFSDPANDLAWFETTNLPPTRDDLGSNETFAAFLEENPALVQYAEAIPYAVPPIVNQNFADIQTALSEQGLAPAVRGDKTPEQAWEDAKAAMQALLGE
ncbi:extracellular solute-binding protein [Truepera radiovictrix]|uniref:Extracellular solute-binding protein family 1 n=1 Tax=Truepera radiovictrix (strain DSM 17093 / CIP 108686 / LMG 22925 / RQ-24) TaxID=649638 RepID=D7CQG2_TRURR|nr:ABC transporter substrate-binding protein [Truepera radiovictrix]ADI14946.1 extracellular solute-binding protein family 1 [Truepera radiovictrix DSM 17093]WMT56498.1 ABC transporter substrate-binding protein [Truepera radiovictrix]